MNLVHGAQQDGRKPCLANIFAPLFEYGIWFSLFTGV